MGNNASQQTPPIQPDESDERNANQIDHQSEYKIPIHQIPSRGNSMKSFIPHSLITGSPLAHSEEYVAPEYGRFPTTNKNMSSAAKAINDLQLDEREIKLSDYESSLSTMYIQPKGEPSYKNTSRISHNYGPSGLAPLAPLRVTGHQQMEAPIIPIMINWSGGGKTVYLTGSFNDYKKKIRLLKSTDDFTTVVDMPLGKHKIRFNVDNEWKCAENLRKLSSDD